ncbi:related to Transcriptional regulatory protein PHO23 [Hanseniaspora guilliermondii]|uniref:Chromatin modification-related protein n=1 Tax=Hanseniaspora guilliermondii TaxID=56406 RepID=A0A1L0B3M1_9ASCO|nr:related to Transcriptional regulatory protein PHO23 [Hanseniaspora guilliermondii]
MNSFNKPPANLNPGLNEIMDVFEEIPLTYAKYLTLWKEIDCKCNQSSPKLKSHIKNLLSKLNDDSEDKRIISLQKYYNKLEDLKTNNEDSDKYGSEYLKNILQCNNDLTNINYVLEELMPSIEENLHVSTIALDQISQSVQRLELAYEACLKNGEIPKALRLGKNNHPAMHLHYELMEKAPKDTMNSLVQIYGLPIIPLCEVTRTGETTTIEPSKSDMGKNGELIVEQGSGLNKTRAAAHREEQVRINALKKQQEAMGHVGAVDKKNPSEVKKRQREPEVDKTKSKKRVTELTRVSDKKKNSTEETYCICEQIAYGEMIACDNKGCPYEWFHLQCVGLTKLPSNNKWYCPHCKKNKKK